MLDRAWLAWLGNKPAARCVKFVQAAGGEQNRALKWRVLEPIPEKKYTVMPRKKARPAKWVQMFMLSLCSLKQLLKQYHSEPPGLQKQQSAGGRQGEGPGAACL